MPASVLGRPYSQGINVKARILSPQRINWIYISMQYKSARQVNLPTKRKNLLADLSDFDPLAQTDDSHKNSKRRRSLVDPELEISIRDETFEARSQRKSRIPIPRRRRRPQANQKERESENTPRARQTKVLDDFATIRRQPANKIIDSTQKSDNDLTVVRNRRRRRVERRLVGQESRRRDDYRRETEFDYVRRKYQGDDSTSFFNRFSTA